MHLLAAATSGLRSAMRSALRAALRPAACMGALALLVLSGCLTSPSGGTGTGGPAPPRDHAGVPVALDGMNHTVAVPDGLQGLAFAVRSTGRPGGEPNVGVTPKGGIFVTAGGLVLRSTDQGRNWTEVFNLTKFWGALYDPDAIPNSWPSPVGPACQGLGIPLVGCPAPDQVRAFTRSSDPQLWVDPETGRVFADFMTGLYCSKMFFSDDEGANWVASPVDCGAPVNDHQKVATGHYGPDVPVPANPVYPNVVYYCYNKLLSTDCAISHDGGLTFNYDRPATVLDSQKGEAQPVAVMGECGGINGHPAAAPDGTLYVPLNEGCPAPVVMVSTDNGLTFTQRVGPTVHGAEEIDPDITVTPDGTAYMLYRGSDHLPYLVRSHDRFATWQGPWLVAPPDVRTTVFTAITSGDNGRIAMAFLGTRDNTYNEQAKDDDPSHAPNATRWNLYNVVSLDAGAAAPTFTAVQATPDADPVQIGCVWLNGGGNPCRNMLDFIDLHHGPDGRPVTVFTDGCTARCAYNATATNLQSRGRTITVSVLSAGPTLFAAKDVVAKPG